MQRNGARLSSLNPLREGERCGGVSALSHGSRTLDKGPPAVIALTCLAPLDSAAPRTHSVNCY